MVKLSQIESVCIAPSCLVPNEGRGDTNSPSLSFALHCMYTTEREEGEGAPSLSWGLWLRGGGGQH